MVMMKMTMMMMRDGAYSADVSNAEAKPPFGRWPLCSPDYGRGVLILQRVYCYQLPGSCARRLAYAETLNPKLLHQKAEADTCNAMEIPAFRLTISPAGGWILELEKPYSPKRS